MFIILIAIIFSLELYSTTLNVMVTRVIDGDTIYVLDSNNQREKVRFWGIDAPELTQRDGAQSGRFLATLIGGQSVTIKILETDRYGRLIAKVYDEDFTYLNEEMIRLGLAWVYEKYVTNQEPHWYELETIAKTKRYGLWRRKKPIPPWEFRKKMRSKNKPN